MKKTPRTQRPEVDDVRPEYQFDYSQAKPNRFASRMTRPVVAIVLESDVAAKTVEFLQAKQASEASDASAHASSTGRLIEQPERTSCS